MGELSGKASEFLAGEWVRQGGRITCWEGKKFTGGCFIS